MEVSGLSFLGPHLVFILLLELQLDTLLLDLLHLQHVDLLSLLDCRNLLLMLVRRHLLLSNYVDLLIDSLITFILRSVF